MNRDCTIDTYVLYHASRLDQNALYILTHIQRHRINVVFDHKNYILNEYRKCHMKCSKNRINYPGHGYIIKWIVDISNKCAKRVDGNLPNKHRDYLLKSLKFHNKDMPFVGVCLNSDDKNLISEDGDYEINVIRYLKNQLGIKVYSISEYADALTNARK